MNLLFICNQGRNRSRTAAELLEKAFNTRSASLYSDRPVTRAQLHWADIIIVMEKRHRVEIANRFPDVYLRKRILCLDMPDIYGYGQPELVTILRSRLTEPLDLSNMPEKKK